VQLTEEVKKTANSFESLGVVKDDRVAVYLPMVPEAVITLLACSQGHRWELLGRHCPYQLTPSFGPI
jgi:acyl-CoA synthetase (AMP-forming)/AMP-acid ligase II